MFVMGDRANVQTIQVLSAPFADSELNSFESLRCAYIKLLSSMQPKVPHSGGYNPEYVTKLNKVQTFIKTFREESNIDDTYYDMDFEGSLIQSKKVLEWTQTAVDKLGKQCPTFHWIFNLIMDSIVHTTSNNAVGGTSSHLVGVLWINPRENWSDIDMYEFLVHELGHTLLFLHEWRYGLFTSYERLPDTDTFAKSAIRSQMRPMDKAFHSAVVATDVLLLRELIIGHKGKRILHPDTSTLVSMVGQSIKSIREVNMRQGILTDYALGILDQCEDKLKKVGKEEKICLHW
ncbi:hypothetical protein SAMN04488112_108178 [Melghirimyces thermohalophilus]|uniref:HEXXH motif-containing protein n=1 Tax=Melghirimyces thermohalophilus TaxID=1236220 RepID=A0A1G6LY68_9BACL|nr:HEXXH motif-containing putative peptide modification protein [Melghirimyces thermohalophilus]SDC48170.1 hypothetical protein SAMN04488112_108178 [Melghirimyces thermohalophilus]